LVLFHQTMLSSTSEPLSSSFFSWLIELIPLPWLTVVKISSSLLSACILPLLFTTTPL
jgi:hypothetical protein